MLEQNEIQLLRELATKYISYANLAEQKATRELWYSLNSCDMKRPMVLIDQIPWNEICDEALICKIKEPYWQSVENSLRRKIYQWEHMRVDMVLPPYICLPLPVSATQNFGLSYEIEHRGAEDAVNAQSYSDILKDYADIEKINPADISLDILKKEEIEAFADRLFSGICEYRFKGVVMHLGLWDKLSFAKGVTNCYFDIMDRPEFLHDIMQRLTDCTLDAIEKYNRLYAFDTADTLCHCSHTFTHTLPSGTNGSTSDNCWAFGMAQLFSSASPEITREFEVPYMTQIFQKFGAIYYGCCERLDDRLDIIDLMPNIRKVSCSPWSEREAFAEKLPKKYVMSNKPSPAFLSGDSFDEQAVRDDLRRTIHCARTNGLSLELILKDISTIRGDVTRLWRWAQIASEEVMSF